MTPVTNAFLRNLSFPLPFSLPLQLATCRNREKQHRQHTKEAQRLWQSSAEVNTALRCQSAPPSPNKSNEEANHWDISIPLLNLLWVLLTSQRLAQIDLSLISIRVHLSELDWCLFPTIPLLKQLTFPLKFLSQGKSTQPEECCFHQKGLLCFSRGTRGSLNQLNTLRHSNSFLRNNCTVRFGRQHINKTRLRALAMGILRTDEGGQQQAMDFPPRSWEGNCNLQAAWNNQYLSS